MEPRAPDTPMIASAGEALQIDLYQLTMVVGYLKRGMADAPVVCEAFIRRLPPRRSVLLVAGLERVVTYLQNLRVTRTQLRYLRSLPVLNDQIDDAVAQRLLQLRFEGDLWAMPEGTVAFANEPVLRIEAPLWQAQLVETFLLSVINHATLVASKAARVVAAAGSAGVMEFGTRRTHPDAAVDAARAAYVAGCIGTSNVGAGLRYGIPVYGTMSHMWTMVHSSEEAAFDSYLAVYPHQATLLVDTYGTLPGTRRACQAARRLGDPLALSAVRVDSELFDETQRPTGICRRVRQVLDAEGFSHTRIVVSDDMNEQRIAALLDAGEPIDAFGVGTELVTSKDAPALGGVYKVVWADGRPTIKLSPGKVTYPGAHQVFRQLDEEGRLARDVLGLADEALPGEPLLRPILEGGQIRPEAKDRLGDLDWIRRRARAQLATLPQGAILEDGAALVVEPSPGLRALLTRAEAEQHASEEPPPSNGGTR